MFSKTKDELVKYRKLKYYRDIMKINIIFFLFFMLSDSMEIFIPLYFKKNGLSAVTYGSLQSVTTILRMAVIWIMAKPKMKNKRRILELFVVINMLHFGFLYMNGKFFAFYIFAVFILTRTVVNTVLNPYLARLLPNGFMGIGFGVRDVFLSVGCAAGLFISGFLEENLLWFSIYMIVLLAALLFIMINTKFIEIAKVDTDDSEDDEDAEKTLKSWRDIPKRMKVNFVIIVAIGCLIACGLEIHTYSAMIGEDFGVKAQNIYNLYASSVIITAAFSIGGGIIIDRVNSKIMYLAYILVCFLSCFVLVFRTPYAYALSLVFIGIKGVLDNVEQTYFFKAYKEYDMEKLYSVNTIIQMILAIVSPMVFGFLYDVNFNLMLMAGIVCLAAAMVVSFGIVDINKQSE